MATLASVLLSATSTINANSIAHQPRERMDVHTALQPSYHDVRLGDRPILLATTSLSKPA